VEGVWCDPVTKTAFRAGNLPLDTFWDARGCNSIKIRHEFAALYGVVSKLVNPHRLSTVARAELEALGAAVENQSRAKARLTQRNDASAGSWWSIDGASKTDPTQIAKTTTPCSSGFVGKDAVWRTQ
jgi:hypothetical protein